MFWIARLVIGSGMVESSDLWFEGTGIDSAGVHSTGQVVPMEVTAQMPSTREKLQQELERTLAEIQRVERKLEDKADYGIGKGDSTIYEWEFNLALRQSLEKKVRSLKSALRKVEEGEYGICRECGEPISEERLAILPQTTVCVKCARKQSRRRRGAP
jgi:DnaK suppressor protein